MSISTAAGGNVTRNLAIVKQYFKKPMMLVVAILSLVTVGANFMLDQATKNFSQDFIKFAQSLTEGMEGVDIQTQSSNNTLGYLLSFVVTVSLFLIFFTSLMPKGGPTIFFSVLHILSVLQLILYSITALFVVITELVFALSSSTIVKFLVGNDVAGFGGMTDEQMEMINRSVDSFRLTILIFMLITIVIFGVYLYYINAQTAFLKSVTLTCKNPQLKSKGAAAYGKVSMVIGVVSLVGIVIIYLLVGNPSTSVLNEVDSASMIDLSEMIKPFLIYSISSAVYIIARGSFAKGWEAFAKDNEDFVYEAVGSSNRQSDASPIPTYKSTTRRAQDARQQSQPYLIGEEQDPNKKSSYIPEELQTDNNFDQSQNMYGQPGFGGDMYGGGFIGGDPYGQQGGFVGGNDPYGQQGGFMGGNDPYGQPGGGFMGGNDPYSQPDPFSQSPMGGDPYGQPGGFIGGDDPYGGSGYNNGMM